MFHLMFVHYTFSSVGLLSGNLLGNSCPLGWPSVLIVFCLFVIFIYFPFWFYGLPKIHKNKEINEACTTSTSNCVELKPPNNLTFRPIVAGATCETHRLSNLIEILLQPYTKINKLTRKRNARSMVSLYQ